MSAFGNYQKDTIVDAIQNYAEANQDMSVREVIESILEATRYGIDMVLYGRLEVK